LQKNAKYDTLQQSFGVGFRIQDRNHLVEYYRVNKIYTVMSKARNK